MAKQAEVPMIRLRNVNTGALVQVAEEKLPRMGSEWEPADADAGKAAKAAEREAAAAEKAAAKAQADAEKAAAKAAKDAEKAAADAAAAGATTPS